MKQHCITFAPFLKELNGHVKDYHDSLNRVFIDQGYRCTTLVQKHCEIETLPSNWKKGLYNPAKWSRRSVVAKMLPKLVNFKTLFRMKKSYFHLLKSVMEKEPAKETIWLLETFNTFHLYVLNSLLKKFKDPSIKLALIYRYDSKQLFFEGKRDKKLLKSIEKQIGKERLKLFVDTDLLQQELSSFFEQPITLLPIPHTHIFTQASSISLERLTLWWPGVPRSPKGLGFIQKIAQLPALKNVSIVLKVSEKTSGLTESSKVTIDKIPNCLSREQYLEHFYQSDVILLPYSLWNYQYSSSGIFVETLCMGKMPIVSEGIWMAHELKKHQLEELIVDFNREDFFEHVHCLIQDQHIQDKLRQMSISYQKNHNEQQFSKTFFQAL